ncbi:hypothetical protein DFH28DRAFT_895247, partial [Melampsora americana]
IHKRCGATLLEPPFPPEFKWVPLAYPKSNARKYSGPSNSPAPMSHPPFENYLEFCSISPNYKKTQDLLNKYDIISFEMFFSPKLSILKMEGSGFDFGPSLHLHHNAVLY